MSISNQVWRVSKKIADALSRPVAFAVGGLALLVVAQSSFAAEVAATSADYRKATEGEDVVKNKLYPKKGKVELNLPDVGLVLNQSYVNTYLLHGGINYFFSEVWGLGIEGAFAINSDKDERKCVEAFYYNPDKIPGVAECDQDPNLGGADIPAGESRMRYGPAYVPIRELKFLVGGNLIWNPVYGKQIMLMRATAYFDVFVTMGGGLAFSTFYAESTLLRNGKPSRGAAPEGSSTVNLPGATKGQKDSTGKLLYGPEGRPDPLDQSPPYIDFGIGQKYHFAKRFNFKVELRNFTLVGTDQGFENFFTLWGGFGARL